MQKRSAVSTELFIGTSSSPAVVSAGDEPAPAAGLSLAKIAAVIEALKMARRRQ